MITPIILLYNGRAPSSLSLTLSNHIAADVYVINCPQTSFNYPFHIYGEFAFFVAQLNFFSMIRFQL